MELLITGPGFYIKAKMWITHRYLIQKVQRKINTHFVFPSSEIKVVTNMARLASDAIRSGVRNWVLGTEGSEIWKKEAGPEKNLAQPSITAKA